MEKRKCSEVYSGDLSAIPYDDVRHINEVCEKNIQVMAMKDRMSNMVMYGYVWLCMVMYGYVMYTNPFRSP